ncbi:MAG TPA: aspartate aminotransferase family protein [Thermoleophilaceae bacterium]|nr:aspartate aminotransferase family protein [Thermoleophilaceae bacterium]
MRPITDTYLWHSQAHMPTVKRAERVIVRGEGAYVWDAEGNRVFDAPASLWYCNIGHGREEVAEAVKRQIVQLESYHSFQQYTSAPTLELCERLVELAPMPNPKVFLTSGGSDAIDTAAKLARRYWAAVGRPEKQGFVTRESGYHGLHGVGTSIGGLEFNREGFGHLLSGTARIPANDAAALEALLRTDADTIAAFFCEPVMGAGGVIPPAPGFLESARDICREHDVLFVSDEVITGFGRTGHMFASERFDLAPDLLTFAKGVTSGYQPLGGVFVSERIWAPFWDDESDLIFRHGLTYSGHAAACAAAIANLDILEREGLVARVKELEGVLVDKLAEVERHPGVREVRAGVGLLAAIQLEDEGRANDVVERCYSAGILTRALPGGALQVSPPFITTEDELEQLATVVVDALDGGDGGA